MRHPSLSSLASLQAMMRGPSLGGSLRVVPKTGVLREGCPQEAWIPWGPGTARGTLVSNGPIVAPGPATSADSTDEGDVAGPITCRAQGEHASPRTPSIGLLPFCIMERVAHGAVFSWILASWRRTIGEELELGAYKKGGDAPSFPLSMACLLLPP